MKKYILWKIVHFILVQYFILVYRWFLLKYCVHPILFGHLWFLCTPNTWEQKPRACRPFCCALYKQAQTILVSEMYLLVRMGFMHEYRILFPFIFIENNIKLLLSFGDVINIYVVLLAPFLYPGIYLNPPPLPPTKPCSNLSILHPLEPTP